MSTAREPYVGRRIKRVEDPRLIRGLGHYVDDLRLADLHCVSILRSPHAHAKIASLDLSAARAAPGVVAVVTVEDLDRAKAGDVPVGGVVAGMKIPPHRPLARGKVRFVGEPIAAVVASSAAAARDAVDLIAAEYDPLPAVVDPEAALTPGAPLIHEELETNRAYDWSLSNGDIDRAFKSAARVVSQRMVHQRLIPCSLEPRGVVAQFLPGERQLTFYTSTQIPHLVRTMLAGAVGLPENQVRLIAPEVGGGFGSKLNFYAEEILLAFLAIRLGPRPVKWIETRRENFAATIHGRGQVGTIEAAMSSEGRILGLRYRSVQDLGAYPQLLGPVIPTLTGLMAPGPYKMDAVQVEVTGVYTNQASTDAYRGAGRPEATYQIERLMDIVADELRIDPIELRRRNLPSPEEFPFKTITGLTYDSGNYQKALDRALEIAGITELREEQRRLRDQGKLIGIGLSTYVEICALGPSPAVAAGGWESATVRVEPSAKVTVLTGASPHGQGEETSFAQVAADFFGIPLEDVVVKHGDTGEVQYGIGTFGSRNMAVGGTALVRALERVGAKAKQLAAHLLGSPVDSVTFANGTYTAPGSKKSVSFAEVAAAAHRAASIPDGFEPGLSAIASFEPKNFTFPFGSHICVVEVDRETGDVKFLRYVAVDDCGNAINPLLVDGQIHGGIAQSIGQALYEQAVYDEAGQLITGELMDYAIPKAHQCPRFETDRTVTPTNVNPLGVKGVGEAGTIGATPAIVNAVLDALEPFGVRHIDMPLRPEKIWKLMRKEAKP
jgi:carbon-monoxide dehydrogenase large subunit